MGGEIIRVATVLGMLYGAEFLAGNPRRAAAFCCWPWRTDNLCRQHGGRRVTAGFWADFKSADFGSSGAPGLLKRLYLLLGAAFLFVLLAKKTTASRYGGVQDFAETAGPGRARKSS